MGYDILQGSVKREPHTKYVPPIGPISLHQDPHATENREKGGVGQANSMLSN